MATGSVDNQSGSIQQDKQTKQVQVKLNAKHVQFKQRPKQKDVEIEEIFNHDLEFSHAHDQNTPIAKDTHYFSNQSVSTHLIIAVVLSFMFLLHAIYWEFAARFMNGFHQKWMHFQLCASFSVINLLPALSIWIDVFSPFVSIAVCVHGTALAYYVVTTWVYDTCAHNMLTEICSASMLYKDFTLGLVIMVIMHQWFILVSAFRVRQTQKAIDAALENAKELGLDEADELERTEYASGTEPESQVIDISMKTSADIANHRMSVEELDERYGYFSAHSSHDHSGHSQACKHCFWQHQDSDIGGKAKAISYSSGSDVELGQSRSVHLSIDVPPSPKIHAIPVIAKT